MIFLFLLFQIVFIYCQDNILPEYDSVVIGNLRKRDQIPLYRYNRRWDQENLNYRRTRDIREDNINNYLDTRRYELPSNVDTTLEPNIANMPELKARKQLPLNVLNRRWNDVELNDLRRFGLNTDDDFIERTYELSDMRKEEIFKEEAQEDLERLQRELKWFTIADEN